MSTIENLEDPRTRIARYKQLESHIIPNFIIIEKLLNDLLNLSKISNVFDESHLSGTLELLDRILSWFEFFDKSENSQVKLLRLMENILTDGIKFIREFSVSPEFQINLTNLICISHHFDDDFDGKFQIPTNFKNLSLLFNQENKGLNEFEILIKKNPSIAVLHLLIINYEFILRDTELKKKYFHFFSFDYELIDEKDENFKVKAKIKVLIDKFVQKKINFKRTFQHNLNCENLKENREKFPVFSCTDVKYEKNLYVTFEILEGSGFSVSYVNLKFL